MQKAGKQLCKIQNKHEYFQKKRLRNFDAGAFQSNKILVISQRFYTPLQKQAVARPPVHLPHNS